MKGAFLPAKCQLLDPDFITGGETRILYPENQDN